MSKTTRLITIETRGPIPQKNGISGPIKQAYNEDVRVIARMVMGKIAVREHFEDGDSRLLVIRDIPELTATTPAILPRNEGIKKEMARSQQVIREQKEADLAAAKEKIAAKEAANVETPEQVAAPVASPVAETTPDLAAMTKSERKSYLNNQANNTRQEEVTEAK